MKYLQFSAIIGIVFLFGCQTPQKSAVYEYKLIRGRPEGRNSSLPPLETQVEAAALEGWELVTAVEDEATPLLIFKRPK